MKTLCVDPGEDTGYSIWVDDELIEADTEKMWVFADMVWYGQDDPESVFYGIERIICEDFRIYPWKVKDLAWDQVRTARLIGALTFMASVKGWEFILQPAKIKERAEAAGAEELFLKPLHENRHANDSIRHGIYYKAVTQQGVKVVAVDADGE